jgi:hypothetical protein
MAHRVHRSRPGRGRPQRPHIHRQVWEVQREIALLTAQRRSEQDALATWQRRLELRVDWERTHAGASQIPQLQQACAAAHALVVELERKLLDAQVRLRTLRSQGGDVQPAWSART